MSGLPRHGDASNSEATGERQVAEDEADVAAGSSSPDELGRVAQGETAEMEHVSENEVGDEGRAEAIEGDLETLVDGEDLDELDDIDDEGFEDVDPIEEISEAVEDEEIPMQWYILKIQVNRESSICEALQRRVKVSGLDRYFGEILVPTEDVREFTKAGKQRTVKRKLYPGYIVVEMALNEETWFLVRETPGIGDFTGSAGKPAALSQAEVDRIIRTTKPEDVGEEPSVKIGIKFKIGDRIRVKEGYFQNFEGDVETIDESNGRITVMINIFGRPTPVELDHWQVESV